MSDLLIRIVFDGEEACDFYVDETYIANANHDEHGWAGMEAMQRLAKGIGEALDIKVVEE